MSLMRTKAAFDQKYTYYKNWNIRKSLNNRSLFENIWTFIHIFFTCDAKAEFSTLLLQYLVSHSPSEFIWIFWFNVENSWAA